MNQLQYNILSCLAYYSIFDYPLKKEEIHNYLNPGISIAELNDVLEEMTRSDWIGKHNEFYSVNGEPAHIERRLRGNELAAKQLKLAKKAGAFLSSFPYVRAIGISGSLSKNFADEKSDFDFFIITAKNRVWIARSIMHLFRKFTMLAGKHHWFCMNYYVDEDALEIKEKNIFTATEMITLIPVRGKRAFHSLFTENKWVERFYPQHTIKPPKIDEVNNNPIKWLIEKTFNNGLGEWIDNRLMKMTSQRWQKKTKRKSRNSQGILLGMDAGKHYAKPNPEHLQSKILSMYKQKMEELIKLDEVSLNNTN